MSEPLTRADLTAALETQSAVFKRDLNDRFEHYEKRQDERHREMMQGFAQVIENVNAHTTDELNRLRADLDIRKEFDHLTAVVAQRLGITVADLIGR